MVPPVGAPRGSSRGRSSRSRFPQVAAVDLGPECAEQRLLPFLDAAPQIAVLVSGQHRIVSKPTKRIER
jgi:hypothetical protein